MPQESDACPAPKKTTGLIFTEPADPNGNAAAMAMMDALAAEALRMIPFSDDKQGVSV